VKIGDKNQGDKLHKQLAVKRQVGGHMQAAHIQAIFDIV
jgi:hypothetical protein